MKSIKRQIIVLFFSFGLIVIFLIGFAFIIAGGSAGLSLWESLTYGFCLPLLAMAGVIAVVTFAAWIAVRQLRRYEKPKPRRG